MGRANNVTERECTAVGNGNTVSGLNSSAFCFSNTAAGNASLPIGDNSRTAVGAADSAAIGNRAVANGVNALAAGSDAISATKGTAVGNAANARINGAVFGNGATAAGNGAAFGDGASVGTNGIALGAGTAAAANTVSVGGRKIQLVDAGVAPTDAVNVSQL